VAVVTAYFARRSADPQTVADLTADTFVQAITSFTTFNPRTGCVSWSGQRRPAAGSGGRCGWPPARPVRWPASPLR